jgi:hypothetical protein
MLAAGVTLSVGLAAQSAQTASQDPKYTSDAMRAKLQAPTPAKPAATVAGKWNMSSEIQGQTMTSLLEFKLDGKKVTGTTTSDRIGTVPLEGEFENDKLTFSVTFNVQGGSMSIMYTATLKDDKLTGTLTIPQMGEIPWKAERVKDK